MQLIELISDRQGWADDETIYVTQPWSRDAKAILVAPAPDTTEPISKDGFRFDYFLETYIAKEFLADFDVSVEGVNASEEDRCDRLIRYATNDT